VPAVLITPVLNPVLDVPTDPPQLPVPPIAAQAVALLLLQERVDAWPVCMVEGDALNRLTVAAGGGDVTLMLMEFAPLAPPGPVQFSVYV
jgi:hypothetical protein